MSAFSTDPSEFMDIIICMLLDAVKHGDEFEMNDRWTKLINQGKLLGIKTIVYFIYLTTDVNARIKYKMLASALRAKKGCYIHIRATEDEPEFETLAPAKSVNKDLVKKIFKKVKEVRFKTSMPITEERLDKIIDYCENEYYNK